MEVDLKIYSEDHLILPIFQNENETEETKEKNIIKCIKQNLKEDVTYSQNFKEDDYSYNLQKKNNNEYIVEFNCENKLSDETKSKFNLCVEKEKILNSKKEEFKKLQNDFIIDEKLLEKKLTSLIEGYGKGDDDKFDQIIKHILDYESFNKEEALLKEKLIKYRTSPIIQLCFSIYWKRLHNCIIYILNKYIIFLYNEKIFKATSKILPKLVRKIIEEIYDTILSKISLDKIFLKQKGDYQKKIKLYKEICSFFFILQSFDNNIEKSIFKADEDINLEISENTFDNIGRFNKCIIKRTGLNTSLESILNRVNIEDIYEKAFRRILLLYERYKANLPLYKRCKFLYD